jgi:hypothetical protein
VLLRSVAEKMRRDQTVRRDATLHPRLQRGLRIELVRAGAAGAMGHAGREKQPVEIADRLFGVFDRLIGYDTPEIVYRFQRRRHRVGQPVILKELSPGLTESVQIGAVRVDDRGKLGVGGAHIGAPIEIPPVPGRIKGPVAPIGEPRGLIGLGGIGPVKAPAGQLRSDGARSFAAVGPAEIDSLTRARIMSAFIHRFQSLHLRIRQTGLRVASLTSQSGGIEIAAAWIVQEIVGRQPSVFGPVVTLARLDDRIGDHREFGCGEDGFRIVSMRMIDDVLPEETRVEVSAIVPGIPGDNSVEIDWEALRLHQRLVAARGAASKIVVSWRLAIERADQKLRPLHRFMNRSIAPIRDALRASDRERRIGSDVSGVGCDRYVRRLQPGRHVGIAHVGAVAAVAEHLQLPVPVCLGKPDLEPDDGTRHRRDDAVHATKSGQIRERFRVRRSIGTSRNGLGGVDLCLRQRQCGEISALGGVGRDDGQGCDGDRGDENRGAH